MSQKSYYKIVASPRFKRNFIGKILHNPKKRQILISVLAVYTLVGSLVALTFFTRSEQNSSAYAPALITSAIRLDTDKEYSAKETIKARLTLQNTSATESIKNITLDLQSTRDYVSWNTLDYKAGDTVLKSYPVIKNKAELDLLTSGERIEYELSGNITQSDLKYATVIGKISFTNAEGAQTFSTNKILIKSLDVIATKPEIIEISSDQNIYSPDAPINLTVTPTGEFDAKKFEKMEGKMYITNKQTHEVVVDATCTIDLSNPCTTNIGTLPVGKYSTLFMSKDEQTTSLLGAFEVLGDSANFKPNASASLTLPFGSTSINGMVPIYASRVLDNNKVVNVGDVCNYSILKDGKKVTEVKAQVNSDGTCYTTLSATQLPGDGIYTVVLDGTEQKKDVAVISRGSSLLKLEQKSLALLKNKPIDFYSTGIFANGTNSSSPTPVTSNEKITLGLIHQPTGTYEEITSSNGEGLRASDGNFSASISGQHFEKGGSYLAFYKTADGQLSDFVSFAIDDKEIGFVDSSVLVDSTTNLKIGVRKEFSLAGVTDRNNNPVIRGECAADIYTRVNATTPLVTKGEIRDGVCKVVSDADQITSSGPILVSFNSDSVQNKINQSRQFTINSGDAVKYTGINLEYEPARSGYANTAYIGPVTDGFGNLTESKGKRLLVKQGEEVIKEIPVIIENGFARVTLPGSILRSGEMTLLLQNIEDGTIVISRTISVTDTDQKLIIPAFPTLQNSDEQIKAHVNNLPDSTSDTECKLQYVRSEGEFAEYNTKYNTDKSICEFNNDLTQYRNNQFGLFKLTTATGLAFHGIVENEASTPSNLFVFAPQMEKARKDEVNVSLLTSPIVDKQGLAVSKGQIKTQINGRIEELAIENGTTSLNIPASKLDTKDIIQKGDQKYLELNINAKASVTSLSKTNTLSLYLGNKAVSNYPQLVKPKKFQTEVAANTPTLFQFETEFCNVLISSRDNVVKVAQTHHQGDTCFVQVNEQPGTYSLSFEEQGFVKYSKEFKIVNETATVNWCTEKGCTIEIIGQNQGSEKVIVYDEDNQYNFENKENNKGISVEQNGLNPLKEYLVEVQYQNDSRETVSFYNTLRGDLIGK